MITEPRRPVPPEASVEAGKLDKDRGRHIVRLAERLVEGSVALLYVAGEKTLHLEASAGAASPLMQRVVAELPWEDPLCSHVRRATEAAIVPDALADPQFGESAFVSGDLPVRFIAGISWGAEETVQGVLWVLDASPRIMGAAAAAEVNGTLQDLACLLEAAPMHWETPAPQERASRLFDAIPVMIAVYDPVGDVTRVNAEFERVTGWTTEDAKTTNLIEACYPDPEMRARVYEAMDAQDDDWHEFEVTTKTGARVLTSWRNISLSDDIHVGIGIDISEQHKREEALHRAKEEAEEMNRLKSAFLANMSHEIRTPLTTIIGFAEIVENELLTSKDLQLASEFASMIRRSGHRLLETINSVLDLSKLEAGTMQLHPEMIDVRTEIRETVAFLRQRAADAGTTLRVELPEEQLWAYLDVSGFHRVLINLVGNAIKFTPEGEIVVRAQSMSDRLQVEVEDTGVGIEEEFLSDLFEAFSQESTGQKRSHEGSGLGLSITKQLVELMGGTIEVESEKDIGTCFTVMLPLGTEA